MTETDDMNSLSLDFVEGLYSDFLRDPASVAPEWRRYFEALGGNGAPQAFRRGPAFRVASVFNPPARVDRADGAEAARVEAAALQDRVDQLIRAYRVRGHMVAQLDPLGRPRRPQPELEPAFYGFGDAHMDLPFSTHRIEGNKVLTLRQILDLLRKTYCRSIGVQFMHIDDLDVKTWLQERMEGTENRLALTRDEQLRILTRLTDAVIFEEFVQKKYLGAKTFSLEGGESLIPLLDLAIENAGEQGIGEVVMAMAHRGRLNVLANIIGKSPSEIFHEFEDKDAELMAGRGDVKYHLGYGGDWKTASGRRVHLALCFNPSHLEFVNPVALGRLRAKQDRAGDHDGARGMALLIHGDAAFAGEGTTQETLNLSQLDAYQTGGTIRVVVNNQIGFTTPPSQGRSSTYATDVAKMIQSPIFHVNGEDPEAVAQVVRLALGFRQKFKRDVVIDMYCYRRRGHNEGDEPSFTQPVMYRAIERRKPVREGYLEHLLKLGGVTREEADAIAVERKERLEQSLSEARSPGYAPTPQHPGIWTGFRGGPEKGVPDADTGFEKEHLSELLEEQTKLPEGFHPHPKIQRAIEVRKEMARGKRPLDWSAAESLAFGTLAVEGVRVRLTGQDTERGTFSQRHSMLHDYENGSCYMPLRHLSSDQAPIEIVNSPLSETGVLGFEYGYSLEYPDALVLWEAQFGDFINAAQVIVDQFLVSAEDKWNRLSGLVLLLPHGFEGMGPEHSSARLERFLSLAAEDNIQVVNPTTPAQYFHVLRRQARRPWRKPLIVMTPKSLLRHPRAVSTLEECAAGRFRRILPDALSEGGKEGRKVARVLICSGKIYYELEAHRTEAGREDVAILRFEQLYPLPEDMVRTALAKFAEGTPVTWVQEEPENMGAWPHMRRRFGEKLLGKFPFNGVFRPASASPATGSARSHKMEQRAIIEAAFGAAGG